MISEPRQTDIASTKRVLDGVLAHASVAATGKHHDALASTHHVCGGEESVRKLEGWVVTWPYLSQQ